MPCLSRKCRLRRLVSPILGCLLLLLVVLILGFQGLCLGILLLILLAELLDLLHAFVDLLGVLRIAAAYELGERFAAVLGFELIVNQAILIEDHVLNLLLEELLLLQGIVIKVLIFAIAVFWPIFGIHEI